MAVLLSVLGGLAVFTAVHGESHSQMGEITIGYVGTERPKAGYIELTFRGGRVTGFYRVARVSDYGSVTRSPKKKITGALREGVLELNGLRRGRPVKGRFDNGRLYLDEFAIGPQTTVWRSADRRDFEDAVADLAEAAKAVCGPTTCDI